MNTTFFIRAKSIYDEQFLREIPLQKICETFGLDPKTIEFCARTVSGNEEIVVTCDEGYGVAVDGRVGNDSKKDLYALANIEFSGPDDEEREEGFVTYVGAGFWSAADENEDDLCEVNETVVFINQRKREAGDDSQKVCFYDDNHVKMMPASSARNMAAKTMLDYTRKE